MSRSLADLVTPSPRYARSANLERDAQAEDIFAGYLVTGRVVDLVDRITTAVARGHGGAWSVTGPYGSGKSSFGLFIDALYGPGASPAFREAQRMLNAVDRDLGDRVRRARRGHDELGFGRALATAHTEPVTHTVTRALGSAASRLFGGFPSANKFSAAGLLRAALDDVASADLTRTGPAPGSLIEITRALTQHAPVLLVIDEFGKNLEAARERSDADLYLLQLLAETAASDRGAPLYLITMQHLAFGEYAALADDLKHREWMKVQGRFEDVLFIDSESQTRELVSKAFEVDEAIQPDVRRWAKEQAATMRRLNLLDVADDEQIASCFPLNPVVLAVLPELCRRYGQNERTLFSFLTGAGANAVPERLRGLPWCTPLPTINLSDVYEFFVEAGGAQVATGTRWAEIALRLRDAAAIPPLTRAVAKSIAVLNLLSTTGPLRASQRLLQALHGDADEHVEALTAAGLVTYRKTTDEYRIWHGTDLDLEALIDRHRTATAQERPDRLMAAIAPLQPIVAVGHSMRTDTLRTFDARYAADATAIKALPPSSTFDGAAYIALDSAIELSDTAPPGLPVVVLVPADVEKLIAAARELHALRRVLQEPAVAADWVARSEMRELTQAAESHLAAAFDVASASGSWFLLTDHGVQALDAETPAAATTAASDLVYTSTAIVRNETINRVELTSQGAKARRLLLLAMLQRAEVEGLGLEGFGPEVAMYRAVLEQTQLHRFDEMVERWILARPLADAELGAAWDRVEQALQGATERRVSLLDIHAALQLPPFGMKDGVIPVLVTAVLVAKTDEIAIYEHGRFRPILTEEICDRMVRNPGHFELKHYANAAGARRTIVERMARRLDLDPKVEGQRVGNVLAVVADLVRRIAALPPYTRGSTDLSACAIAVRDTIASATEPDQLLFTSLPLALGFRDIKPTATKWPEADDFTSMLARALDELDGYYGSMLGDLRHELFKIVREAGRPQLAALAAVIEDEVINPEIRAFVLALSVDLFDDDHWIENIATIVTRTAPRHWTDADRRRFTSELTGKAAAFRRLLVLHTELKGLAAQPFEAQRITRTLPTGDEHAILVGLDREQRSLVAATLRPALDALSERLGDGQRAAQALLAWAAEQVLQPDTVVLAEEREDASIAKVVNNV